MILPLFILFLISAAGMLLYFFPKISGSYLNLLIAVGAGSMLSVSLIHILPEALEGSEYARYVFFGGFLLIYLIEEILTPHMQDHAHEDHTHEDPHEHYEHIAIVTWIAIFIHTLFDGLGIRAGFGISESLGYSILLGIAIHQIPVSLSLAAIFRTSKFTRVRQLLFLLLFAGAAPIGYVLSDLLLTEGSLHLTVLATAFAGGSLLYVATADLLPVIHNQTKHKYWTILLFLTGAIGMTAVKWFE